MHIIRTLCMAASSGGPCPGVPHSIRSEGVVDRRSFHCPVRRRRGHRDSVIQQLELISLTPVTLRWRAVTSPMISTYESTARPR